MTEYPRLYWSEERESRRWGRGLDVEESELEESESELKSELEESESELKELVNDKKREQQIKDQLMNSCPRKHLKHILNCRNSS